MYHFDLIDVKNEEWEFTEGDKAVLGRSNLDNLLQGAALEREIVKRDINLKWRLVTTRCVLEEASEAKEALVETCSVVPFSLFLLKLVHLIHFVSALEVDILSSDTRLLVELNVRGWLVINQNRCLQMEMDDDDELISCAGLIEQVLHIGEADVHFVTLGRDEPDTV